MTNSLKGPTMTKTKSPGICEELDIQVGDVFAYSWGYDQTNVDYVAVIKVMRSMVEVAPCHVVIMDSDGCGSDKVAPGPLMDAGESSYAAYKVRMFSGRKKVRSWKQSRWNGSESVETVVPILDYDHGIARRVDFGEFSRQTSVGWGH